MWALDNRTPYAADRTWIRDANGAEIWIVAVKATYDLLPNGDLRISKQQEKVNTGTVLHADGSPLHETDLGPQKKNTDIWLVGHAYSHDGQPAPRLKVGFTVGEVRRDLIVYGDRYATPSLMGNASSDPTLFTQMPLLWSRAYGGDGPEGATGNPVGRGFTKDERGRKMLPNLEHPNRHVSNLLVTSPSMGVGPIPRHWLPRSQYGGTYDEKWQATRAPLQAEDLDERHWQVAPQEQQAPGRLKGGETVELRGLTPPGFVQYGVYETSLPRISLGFKTNFFDGSSATTRSVIHSVILLPDRPALCVVHHMALPCHEKVNLLDVTFITEKARPLDKRSSKPEGQA